MAYPLACSPIVRAALLLAVGALSACSNVLLPRNVQHVAPPSHSLAEADARLEQVAQRRAAIEAGYSASEQVCYTKFFVNNCLDRAKENRRAELAAVRAVEIEAEHYKRKARVDERDRALAQALKQGEAEAAARAANPRPVRAEEPAPPPRPGATQVKREQAQAEKRKRLAEKDTAAAARRAEHVARAEEKRQESERRQARRAARRAAQAAESK